MTELLAVDFEVPSSVTVEGGEASAWWKHEHPTEPVVVIKFDECAAVFGAQTGRLVWAPPVDGPAKDIVFVRGGAEALVLYDYAEDHGGHGGRTNVKRMGLRRFDWRRRAPLEELYIDDFGLRYPAHSLVVGPGERLVAVVSSYCKEIAYELVALETPMRLLEGWHWPRSGHDGPFTVDPVTFSPDGQVLACVDAYEEWWGNSEEDVYEHGAAGGLRCVGKVLLHDLRTNEVEQHDVSIPLPAGWRPKDPEAPSWSGLWAPRFLDDRALEITLPDGQRVPLALPLAPEVHLAVSIAASAR